jgi:hypothetical protein
LRLAPIYIPGTHGDTSDAQLGLLRKLQTFCDLTVTPIIISAVELTIIWNNIPDVSKANTAAQLIPLLLCIILLVMVVIQLALIIGELSQETNNYHENEDNGTTHPSDWTDNKFYV